MSNKKNNTGFGGEIKMEKDINEELKREWDYEKNGDLKPEDFSVTSRRKVLWKFIYGHENEE